MHTIFKQALEIDGMQTIRLPKNYKILHLGVQYGIPTIWYECTSDFPLVDVEIYCFGTGHNMNDLPKLDYIGTVQIKFNSVVLHYYRKADMTAPHYLFTENKD